MLSVSTLTMLSMPTPTFIKIPATQLSVHYALVFVTSIAWVAAMSGYPTQQWILHRFFGLTALILVFLGWIKALERRSVFAGLRAWDQALIDLHAITISNERRQQRFRSIMSVVMSYGLVIATIVVLTGLPSIVRFDAILAPATWVIWSRHIHAIASSALIVLWMVNAYSLMLAALSSRRPERRPHSNP